MSDGKIIIVRRKKVAHAAHHGGSWKVAYADFVTAMMAFFMVMWIMGMDQDVKDMVQGYFLNPVGFKRGYSGGRNILSQGNSISSLQLSRTILLRRRLEEEDKLRAAARAIDLELEGVGLEDLGAAVEVVVTQDGLRIVMMETGIGHTFFEVASARLSPTLHEVLARISHQIAELPNGVIVEGHTDAMPFGGRRDYSNFELSVDRANSARRVLVSAGLPEGHVIEVRGYADRQLKYVDKPNDPQNRRITLLLPFDVPQLDELTESERDEQEVVEALDLISRGGTP